MASDLAEGPVTLDMFRVGQVWACEYYDGTFTVTAVTDRKFTTFGWAGTAFHHTWEVYDDSGTDDDYGDMAIIRRWSLVSDETSEPENKTRWGVIDLDWLQEQVDWLRKNSPDQQYAKGCRYGYANVLERAVEL